MVVSALALVCQAISLARPSSEKPSPASLLAQLLQAKPFEDGEFRGLLQDFVRACQNERRGAPAIGSGGPATDSGPPPASRPGNPPQQTPPSLTEHDSTSDHQPLDRSDAGEDEDLLALAWLRGNLSGARPSEMDNANGPRHPRGGPQSRVKPQSFRPGSSGSNIVGGAVTGARAQPGRTQKRNTGKKPFPPLVAAAAAAVDAAASEPEQAPWANLDSLQSDQARTSGRGQPHNTPFPRRPRSKT
ncbi:uncharacterized protein PV07_00760 [Cladophialophora immunda]|uniref:Uncharacterized protein n=1 Tax=Cladophialophora immunda TaxID=569365 RepID=A0A0D2DE41_9EURO|nr:uncharacterized protein PV07_00760 [Cladophialophora immunda]KIW33949.1 hypothetical protein PV07_00760 [Cladophialophora immunda]